LLATLNEQKAAPEFVLENLGSVATVPMMQMGVDMVLSFDAPRASREPVC
jgi:hypothetical protein